MARLYKSKWIGSMIYSSPKRTLLLQLLSSNHLGYDMPHGITQEAYWTASLHTALRAADHIRITYPTKSFWQVGLFSLPDSFCVRPVSRVVQITINVSSFRCVAAPKLRIRAGYNKFSLLTETPLSTSVLCGEHSFRQFIEPTLTYCVTSNWVFPKKEKKVHRWNTRGYRSLLHPVTTFTQRTGQWNH
jgi:hypothetical protein